MLCHILLIDKLILRSNSRFPDRVCPHLVHIPKFRIGAGKVLANASTPDFSGTSNIILGYALSRAPVSSHF
jgi:hypothetical protein